MAPCGRKSEGEPDYAEAYANRATARHGKTILLYHEQGLGDTLQFCRYASLVSSLGARVLLEVQPSLLSLLAFRSKRCSGDSQQGFST